MKGTGIGVGVTGIGVFVGVTVKVGVGVWVGDGVIVGNGVFVGQGCVLQTTVFDSSGQFNPPFAGYLTIDLIIRNVPPPHETVHADAADQSETSQFMGAGVNVVVGGRGVEVGKGVEVGIRVGINVAVGSGVEVGI